MEAAAKGALRAAGASSRWQARLSGVFARGGTSTGFLTNGTLLAPYDQTTRDAILCAAMGSPDPDGRQIDGLGGGTSSTSKIALVDGRQDMAAAQRARKAGIPLPGVEWADDVDKASDAKSGWEVTYRFGQVPIRGSVLDWGSTCGNLVAAVARQAIEMGRVSSTAMQSYATNQGHDLRDPNFQCDYPVRILCANNGEVVTAHVPIGQRLSEWAPLDVGEASIAGVPGSSASIIIESPLQQASLLPTSRPREHVKLDSDQDAIEISVVNAGLPVIFVRASDLGISFEQLTQHPAKLEADAAVMQRIEHLRLTASKLAPSLASLYTPSSAAPKVCLLHPRAAYSTTGGQQVDATSMDCLVRTISVGQIHRTVPATTLSALGVALTWPDSLVSQIVAEGDSASSSKAAPDWAAKWPGQMQSISVGQPAGVSATCISLQDGLPAAILMQRTSRTIMEGNVLIPSHLMLNVHPSFAASSAERLSEQGHSSLASDASGFSPHRSRTSSAPLGQRRFSTSARLRQPSALATEQAPSTRLEAVRLFRNVARTIARHPAFTKQSRRSVHKLFRDDFEAATRPTGGCALDVHALRERARSTVMLLLAAGHRNTSEPKMSPEGKTIARPPNSRASQLVCRSVLQNLASLTYHLLSPNTYMPSVTKPRLVGGSDSLQRSSQPSRSQISMMLSRKTSGDEDAPPDDTMRTVDELNVIARPARGPAFNPSHSTSVAGSGGDAGAQNPAAASLFPWDGQRPGRHLRAASQEPESIENLEAVVSQLGERVSSFRQEERNAQDSVTQKRAADKAAEYLRQLKSINGTLKAQRRQQSAKQAESDLRIEARRAMADVVQRAKRATSGDGGQRRQSSSSSSSSSSQEDSGALLFGTTRWDKWARGEFLPP